MNNAHPDIWCLITQTRKWITHSETEWKPTEKKKTTILRYRMIQYLWIMHSHRVTITNSESDIIYWNSDMEQKQRCLILRHKEGNIYLKKGVPQTECNKIMNQSNKYTKIGQLTNILRSRCRMNVRWVLGKLYQLAKHFY